MCQQDVKDVLHTRAMPSANCYRLQTSSCYCQTDYQACCEEEKPRNQDSQSGPSSSVEGGVSRQTWEQACPHWSHRDRTREHVARPERCSTKDNSRNTCSWVLIKEKRRLVRWKWGSDTTADQGYNASATREHCQIQTTRRLNSTTGKHAAPCRRNSERSRMTGG